MPSRRASLALVLVLLAPLWVLGMFDRGLWTPDEPREADIAWRMSIQPQHVLPELAGTPFLEKPPLSYWLSAAAIATFGSSAAAARVPNLFYALITTLAIGLLGFAMEGTGVAIVAALIAGSALIAYRVAVWLAPDAGLLAGSAVALLGAYYGYTSPGRLRKLLGYSLMHFGAALGFMAKSAPGFIVPALALLTLIVWERRFTELVRWELYAGVLLQAMLIGPWIVAVAHTPHGAESLRVLFWDNLAGRFAAVPAAAGHDYSQGHVNWRGKYWVELPVYLLPWTLLAAAGLRRAWREVKSAPATMGGARPTAWRFSLCACLPFLLLLSIAATARDVYAAPAILGFALLIGLWSKSLHEHASAWDELSLRATRGIVAIVTCALVTALGILAAAEAPSPGRSRVFALALAVLFVGIVALRCAARRQREKEYRASVIATYAAYAAALVLSGCFIFPNVDRWQDLAALGRRIQTDSAAYDLAVLNPDETTIAMLDFRLRTAFTPLVAAPADIASVVADWIRTHGGRGEVLTMLPGHAPGDVTRLLARWHPFAPSGDGLAGALQDAGIARIRARYELPQGRRYALLAAPEK
jgi:4-amino-4-deoxy-L-arabinose transferase-like glycosyltransferase